MKQCIDSQWARCTTICMHIAILYPTMYVVYIICERYRGVWVKTFNKPPHSKGVCLRASDIPPRWRTPWKKSTVCQSPLLDDISIRAWGAEPNNGEPVCAGGMLDSSSPEDADCGADKFWRVSACVSLLGVRGWRWFTLLSTIPKYHPEWRRVFKSHRQANCHSIQHAGWNMCLCFIWLSVYCTMKTSGVSLSGAARVLNTHKCVAFETTSAWRAHLSRWSI